MLRRKQNPDAGIPSTRGLGILAKWRPPPPEVTISLQCDQWYSKSPAIFCWSLTTIAEEGHRFAPHVSGRRGSCKLSMPGMPDDGAVAFELCDFENDGTADSIFVSSRGGDTRDMASAADHHLLPPHNPYVRTCDINSPTSLRISRNRHQITSLSRLITAWKWILTMHGDRRSVLSIVAEPRQAAWPAPASKWISPATTWTAVPSCPAS